jgi:FkbM family methyltransferase
MLYKIKPYLRDLLPARIQIPLKYWFLWLRGGLEREMSFLHLIIRNQDLCIDVGANRGIYTYLLYRLGAKVEAFEPNLACSNVLNIWSHDKPNINVHAVALSSYSGSATLHIPVDKIGVEHDASASIENTEFVNSRSQLVSIQTLDSYGFKDLKLIKIDVEGHEYSVIEGAVKTIISSRPALLIEIEQRHIDRPIAEVFAKILEFGYQGFFMGILGLTPLEEFNAARQQSMENFGTAKGPYINNFLFLHRVRVNKGEYSALLNGKLLK